MNILHVSQITLWLRCNTLTITVTLALLCEPENSESRLEGEDHHYLEKTETEVGLMLSAFYLCKLMMVSGLFLMAFNALLMNLVVGK